MRQQLQKQITLINILQLLHRNPWFNRLGYLVHGAGGILTDYASMQGYVSDSSNTGDSGMLCGLIQCSYLSHMAWGESHWQTQKAMCRQTTIFWHWSWNQKVFCSRCLRVVTWQRTKRETTELHLHCSPWVFLFCLSSSDLHKHSRASCIATCLSDGNLSKLLQSHLSSSHDRERLPSSIAFIEFH